MIMTELAGLTLSTGVWAQATSVIPYTGTLFSQGQPVSQDQGVKMAFALYTGDPAALPSGVTDAAPAEVTLGDATAQRLWASWSTSEGDAVQTALQVGEAQTISVAVRNGRFLIHLGAEPQHPLPSRSLDQRPLYVVTWVKNARGVFRLPPQKLTTVPHAVTAERASSFEVRDALTVDQITPRERLVISGDVDVQGHLSSATGGGGLLQQYFVRMDEAQTIRNNDPQPINGLRVTITPKRIGSVIEIMAYVSTNAVGVSSFGVFKGGEPTLDNDEYINLNESRMQVTAHLSGVSNQIASMNMIPIYHYEEVGDLSERTYQIYATSGWSGNTQDLTINDRIGGNGSDMHAFSYMTVREIAGEVSHP